MLWLDFETRSECDLKTAGVYNYAQHPSTQVLCMSYAYDDEPVRTWRPGEPMPRIEGQIRAHNAAFERLIFWHVLKMPIPLEQFYCTAAQARANCAPGSLEDVGRFAGTSMRKDHRGAALVRACCIPPYKDDLIPELIQYCEQDVRTMRAVSQSMRELTPEELEDYHVNERINDRGVMVDVALCKAAVKYAAAELAEIEETVRTITRGEILSVRSPRMRLWVMDRVGPEALKLMERADKFSIDKTVRANLLAIDDPEQVPPDVKEVIQCADDLWASSVAKFERLAGLASLDGRVRGAFVFAGGSATGRASSYGAQVHNFTRKCAEDPEAVRHAMVRGHAIVPEFGRRVTDVLRGMLRPALIPSRGKKFVVADWSAIEGRVNPWLSGRGEDKLQQFRDRLDPYVVNAAQTFSVPYGQVDKSQRQVGKVQELACGFGGGVGAFAAMGRVYGLHMAEADARRMVNAWRIANPWSVPFWSDLETAYTRALRNRGEIFTAGRVSYY
jgi:DNA polymerase